MKPKRPSIREVVAVANVSVATVSNVFSGRKRVKENLAKRVKNAAEKLGYQTNKSASQLRSGCNRIIVILVPNLTDTFFSTIVSELEQLAMDQGYDIIVASSHNRIDIEQS
ncbi:MAG: LacI family DNA-binding transcriptional regulator [Ostreibacterium sp.]